MEKGEDVVLYVRSEAGVICPVHCVLLRQEACFLSHMIRNHCCGKLTGGKEREKPLWKGSGWTGDRKIGMKLQQESFPVLL